VRGEQRDDHVGDDERAVDRTEHLLPGVEYRLDVNVTVVAGTDDDADVHPGLGPHR
jgi:hypothetical protein